LSTLGKILTVLVVVVSIAVAVLVSREFALSKNWHTLYEEQAKLTQRALGNATARSSSGTWRRRK